MKVEGGGGGRRVRGGEKERRKRKTNGELEHAKPITHYPTDYTVKQKACNAHQIWCATFVPSGTPYMA